MRAMTRQVARNVRPRLLAVTLRVALMVSDQDLHRLGLRKQWQGVRHGADRLARGVPRHEDAANLRYLTPWRKHDDRSAGAHDEGLREARRAGRLPRRFRAGDHHQVRVVGMYAHLAAQVGQRSPLGTDSVTTDNVLKLGPVVRLDALELCSVHLDRALHPFAAGERFGGGNYGLRLHEYADQPPAVLLGEQAGELRNARSLRAPLNEDHDFSYPSSALRNSPGVTFRHIPRRFLLCHRNS